MSTPGFWEFVESAPLAAAALGWRLRLGGNFDRAAAAVLRRTERAAPSVVCPDRCCGGHRVVPVRGGDGGFIGVCDDEEPCCEDLVLTTEDVTVWELDLRRLERAVARVLGCEARDEDMGPPRTRQIGAFGGTRLPVVLTMPREAVQFRQAVAEVTLRLREHFILLAPTGRFMDATCHGILKTAKAGFFDLESLLALQPDGTLRPLGVAAEWFAPYLPRPVATVWPDSRTARNEFRKAGSVWKVIYEGGAAYHLKDTLGAEYLHHLLRHPSETISAYDLEVTIRPDKRAARSKDTVQHHLDAAALRDYLRQLEQLRHRRDEATDDGDLAAVDRMDAEMEAIESELKRNGQAPDAGERARGNVSKAVASVVQRLRKGDANERAFGDHLEQFLSMGYECVYHQPRGSAWGVKV